MLDLSLKTSSKTNSNALRIAAAISAGLAGVKLAAFFLSGSLLVLASFFDSFADVILSLANSYVQKKARKSPDKEHPFGHGGIEVVSALIQGALLIAFGISLGVEAIQRFSGHESRLFHLTPAGMPAAFGIMLFSALGGWSIQHLLQRAIKKGGDQQRSLAMVADQSHYSTDAIANLLSAVGLAAIYFSGIEALDAALGLAGGLVLVWGGVKVLRQSLHDILHSEVNPEIQRKIVTIAKETDSSIQSIHRLRTREMGPTLFVDFHMTLPRSVSLEEAHQLGERVTKRIRDAIPRADVLIHLDPDSEPPDDLWSPSF